MHPLILPISGVNADVLTLKAATPTGLRAAKESGISGYAMLVLVSETWPGIKEKLGSDARRTRPNTSKSVAAGSTPLHEKVGVAVFDAFTVSVGADSAWFKSKL